GFDPSQSERIFTPFQRLHDPREFEGHGVGLATVKRIVVIHGGRVWGVGEPEEGATIWFTLGNRPRGEQLFLAALLESAAGARYREWAAQAGDADLSHGLSLCAEREDTIAATVREKFAEELKQPADLRELLGAIQKVVAELFGGRSFEEQLQIQAAAERSGEQLWNELAGDEHDIARKAALLDCAALEAASAAYI